MRFALLLAAALGLTACATPPSGPPGVGEGYEHGTQPTVQISRPPPLVWENPQPGPTPLPARNPPARLQSELLRMRDAEVARWALPEHAAATRRIELSRGWMPEINLGWFFEAPVATAFPGVCQVRSRGVNFRKYRESTLTYQQHLDPPLEPYQVYDGYKYRVQGSTLQPQTVTNEACAADLPYSDWFDAPAAQAVFLAVQHLDRARYRPESFRLTCTEQNYNAEMNMQGTKPCDAGAFLEKLTPNLIKRIDGIKCEGALAAVAGPCWKLTYHDPRSPGSGSEFHVLAGEGVVELSQEILPPH